MKIISYKIPIEALYPWENVVMLSYDKDEEKVLYYTGWSLGLLVISLVFLVIIAFVFTRKFTNNKIQNQGQANRESQIKSSKRNDFSFDDQKSGKSSFGEPVSTSTPKEEQSNCKKRCGIFLNCFDFEKNMHLMGTRKHWSNMEIVIDLCRIFAMFCVVLIRTMIYKLSTSKDFMDINLIFKVAQNPFFTLVIFCLYFPDLFLMLSGILSVYSS